jgi:hypothetical protein
MLLSDLTRFWHAEARAVKAGPTSAAGNRTATTTRRAAPNGKRFQMSKLTTWSIACDGSN